MVQDFELDEITYAHKVMDLANFFYEKLKKGDLNIDMIDDPYCLHYIALFKKISANIEDDKIVSKITNSKERVIAISNLLSSTRHCTINKTLLSQIESAIKSLVKEGLGRKLVFTNFLDLVKSALLSLEIYPFICLRDVESEVPRLVTEAKKEVPGDQRVNILARMCERQESAKFSEIDTTICSDIEIEGLYQINLFRSIHNVELSQRDKERYNIRLYKYVREASRNADLLNVFSDGFSPSPKAIRMVYFSAIVMHILGFDDSLALPRNEAIGVLDYLSGTEFVSKDIYRRTMKNLMFRTNIIIPLIGEERAFVLSVSGVVALLLTIFVIMIIFVSLSFYIYYSNLSSWLSHTFLLVDIFLGYLFIVNAASVMLQFKKSVKHKFWITQ